MRSFKEICAASNVTVKEIGKCHKQVLKALETSVNIITIADFMPRFCVNLGKDCSKVIMRKQKIKNTFILFRIAYQCSSGGIAYWTSSN